MPSWTASKAANTLDPYAPFYVKFSEEFVDSSGRPRLRIGDVALEHLRRHRVCELGSLPFCSEGRILQITIQHFLAAPELGWRVLTKLGPLLPHAITATVSVK